MPRASITTRARVPPFTAVRDCCAKKQRNNYVARKSPRPARPRAVKRVCATLSLDPWRRASIPVIYLTSVALLLSDLHKLPPDHRQPLGPRLLFSEFSSPTRLHAISGPAAKLRSCPRDEGNFDDYETRSGRGVSCP